MTLKKILNGRAFSVTALLITVAVVLALLWMTPNHDYGDAFWVWLWPVIIFVAITCFHRFHFPFPNDISKKDLIAAGGLTLLFAVMSSVKEMLSLPVFMAEDKGLIHYLLFPLYGVFFAIAAIALYCCLLFAFHASFQSKQTESRKVVRWCIHITVFFSLIYAFGGYPAVMYNDGVTTWWQAINLPTISDWHTFGYALIVKVCYLIWNNPFGVILLQTVLWIVTHVLILLRLKKYKGDRACIVYTVLFLTVGILAYTGLHLLLKDCLFCTGLLGCIFLMWCVINHPNVKDGIYLALYGILTSLTRHGGVTIIMIGLVGILIYCFIKNRTHLSLKIAAVCLAAVFVAYSGVSLFVRYSDRVVRNPSYVTFTVPLHMLASYAASGFEISEETTETMEKIMPIEEWAEAYRIDPYLADTCSRAWSLVGERINEFDNQHLQGAVIKANWEYFSTHPFHYMEAFFDINSLVWEMSRSEGYAEWTSNQFNGAFMDSIRTFPDLYESVHDNLFRNILEPIVFFACEQPLWRLISCRGGIALWLILVFLYIVYRRDRKNVLTILPILGYAVVLFLSLPAQHSRYILPFIECAILFFVMTFYPDAEPSGKLSKNE